ncbi:hypothetical protein [Desulfovibrio sp. DV]|uniref:hypothetical protein n=1 Tax=Desulfovibrio sp. DV TaxID=1844708 RepID=UPI00094BA416|nr:hypothetical protein [Desulfovibrio sp. DV]
MDRVAQPAGNLPGQQGTRHFAINAGFDEKDGSDIFPTEAMSDPRTAGLLETIRRLVEARATDKGRLLAV